MMSGDAHVDTTLEESKLPSGYRRYSRGASLTNLPIEDTVPPPEHSGHPSRRKIKYRKTVQGVTIYKGHPSYDIMKNIQMGIRYSVGRVIRNEGDAITMNDVRHSIKREFPRSGSSETPAHASTDFKWKDYNPFAFQQFRKLFEIDAADYMISLCGDDALRELPTPGKSGALFYLSQDNRFVIKTISKRESKFLRMIMPDYHRHFLENPNHLLTRFYGHFRISTAKGRGIRMVIMNNILQTTKDIHERYDLKGSKYGRFTPQEARERDCVTFKDIDFLEMQQDINLSGVKPYFQEQLQRDSDFLQRLGIMDYSLFFGVHYEFVASDNGDDIGYHIRKPVEIESNPLKFVTHSPPFMI
eukprot:TRINITY_DN3327_c0_g1_i1.p1 TRINITY_DN3327_c0_g1~~TRINITY_DN3327_c0_g1_i1.p1  ORF type:complete len:357 (+),score=65.62 TRINITY_DN3327_c0_g1_i1:78-1148(+)